MSVNLRRIDDFDADKVSMRAVGIASTAAANATTSIDHTLAAARLLTGLKLLVWNAEPGDKASLQVVHPTYGVLDTFGLDWNIDNTSVLQALPAVSYPASLVAGLILRVSYAATAAGSTRAVGVNFEFHEAKV